MIQSAIGLLGDLVVVGEYPRPRARDAIIDTLLSAVTGGEDSNRTLIALFEDPGLCSRSKSAINQYTCQPIKCDCLRRDGYGCFE